MRDLDVSTRAANGAQQPGREVVHQCGASKVNRSDADGLAGHVNDRRSGHSGFKECFRGEGQPTASAHDATVAPVAIQRQHSCFAFGRLVVALYGCFGDRQRVR